MDKKYLQRLARKVTSGKATAEEEAFLRAYYDAFDKEGTSPFDEHLKEEIKASLWAYIDKPEAKVIPMYKRLPFRIVAAAMVFVVFGVAYLALHKTKPVQQVVQLKPGTFKNDAVPGNKAILTLASGKQIAVGNIKGQIATQGSTSIQKAANGEVVYTPGNTSEEVAYNTFTVPRGGGKHAIQLADGTMAVLDAASSIRFPVAFNGRERKVSITGQVYFEVVHNTSQPFFVTVNDQTIEDVGTHFNVNAFDAEVKTTLLEGSIKVNNILLTPGQQAIESAGGKLSVLNHVDAAEVIAWKNDLFMFSNNTSLQTVMNQLSRWYDMEVVYEGKGKTYHFGGDMPRYSKLSDVLKILSYNGVQFSVDGKKIIVYQ